MCVCVCVILCVRVHVHAHTHIYMYICIYVHNQYKQVFIHTWIYRLDTEGLIESILSGQNAVTRHTPIRCVGLIFLSLCTHIQADVIECILSGQITQQVQQSCIPMCAFSQVWP